MRLACPECQSDISAKDINIQRLIAVCDRCDALFSFADAEAKAKRRHYPQPKDMRVTDGERLLLAFRANFRLDKDENFQASASMSAVFSLITLVMLAVGAAEGIPFFLPLIFAALALIAMYAVALIAYNRTVISMDHEELRVARLPLPGFAKGLTLSLHEIDSFACEETRASQDEGYDTPRFHVYANLASGRRRVVAADLIEDYGYFVAGRLNARLGQISESEREGRLAMNDLAEQPQAASRELDLEDRQQI